MSVRLLFIPGALQNMHCAAMIGMQVAMCFIGRVACSGGCLQLAALRKCSVFDSRMCYLWLLPLGCTLHSGAEVTSGVCKAFYVHWVY